MSRCVQIFMNYISNGGNNQRTDPTHRSKFDHHTCGHVVPCPVSFGLGLLSEIDGVALCARRVLLRREVGFAERRRRGHAVDHLPIRLADP